MSKTKNILNKLAAKYRFIDFLYFIYNLYEENRSMGYVPEQFAYFGDHACIGSGVKLYYTRNMILKENSVIHSGTTINACGSFSLGRFSGISYNCTVLTVEHRILKAESIPFDKRIMLKPVVIDDFVMIGTNVSIVPGVSIGEGAVVGMGSVVTKDVEPLSIVMGNPATVIGRRDKNAYERNKETGSYQSPIVCSYEKKMPLNMRRKYEMLLKKLGTENFEC